MIVPTIYLAIDPNTHPKRIPIKIAKTSGLVSLERLERCVAPNLQAIRKEDRNADA
jgi:hypothetical protein